MKNISRAALLAICLSPISANAYTVDIGDFSLKLTGYATGGILEPDFDKPSFLGDWRARAELGYQADNIQSVGAVYAIDTSAVDEETYIREVFGFYQNNNFGRVEIGLTDSVARKLGVGLPDVGGLRINDKPLFYKKIRPDGVVIADTTITTGRRALRGNLVSMPVQGAQYGVSVAGGTDDYDYALDAAVKIRNPNGKFKSAWSIAASFMERPDGYSANSFTPDVFADWRAQMAVGMNLQYNSWIVGMDVHAIYDRNPIGAVSDGISAGAGVSYDLLQSSVSLSYIMSNTGIWHGNVENYLDNTVVASFRYKYSQNVDLWMSGGVTSKTPFMSVAMRLTF